MAPPQMYVDLELVSGTLFGNRFFADVVRLR